MSIFVCFREWPVFSRELPCIFLVNRVLDLQGPLFRFVI